MLVRGLDARAFGLRGTERVPGLTITHERKGVLPAWPSDHFGACATLALPGAKPAAAPAKPAAAKRPLPMASTASAASPVAKRAKSSATYRGAPVPEPWALVDDALLVASFGGAPAAPKRLAGFDFDDTLSPLDFARPEHWSHLHVHAPRVIRKLVEGGSAIAVLPRCRRFLDARRGRSLPGPVERVPGPLQES